MKKSNLKAIILLVTLPTFWLLSSPCHADSNMDFGSLCSVSDNSTMDREYHDNIINLLNSLAANGPIQNGFYKTTVGKGANKIYGLTQCRGDISATDCAACIKNATMARESYCSDSEVATVWFRWCWLRYSNLSFFGEWEKSRVTMVIDNNLEDPDVVSKGLNLTKALASSTPNQPLMFQTAELDYGKGGKTYGMAQCTRDLGKRDCGKCLDFLSERLDSSTRNRRGWGIFASSCSMLYQDYQFYFNISAQGNEGSTRYSTHQVAISMVVPALVLLLVL